MYGAAAEGGWGEGVRGGGEEEGDWGGKGDGGGCGESARGGRGRTVGSGFCRLGARAFICSFCGGGIDYGGVKVVIIGSFSLL